VKGKKAIPSNGHDKAQGKIAVDAFGNRENTQGHLMNTFIIDLINREKYDSINAGTLSQMSGGQITRGRFQSHLRWLKKRGLL
jgi:hypothetical protein